MLFDNFMDFLQGFTGIPGPDDFTSILQEILLKFYQVFLKAIDGFVFDMASPVPRQFEVFIDSFSFFNSRVVSGNIEFYLFPVLRIKGNLRSGFQEFSIFRGSFQISSISVIEEFFRRGSGVFHLQSLYLKITAAFPRLRRKE